MWERHLLNSAALAGAIPAGAEVVDLGSGAGLPGIPVSLAGGPATMTLVEPMQRRAGFLREVLATLDLAAAGVDLRVLAARAEQLPPASADVVLARAVAPLARLLELSLPLLRPAGTLLALKGRSAHAEVEDAKLILR